MKTPNVNKTVIAAALIATGLLGFMWWGKSIQETAATSGGTGAASALVAPEKLYNFGAISMKNGKVTKEFTVTNPTDSDVFVRSLATSCMCTSAFIVEPDGSAKGPFGMEGMGYVPPADETIGSGESRVIRVVFDPNAHGPAGIGVIDRVVTLTDKSGGRLQLEIKAVVTP